MLRIEGLDYYGTSRPAGDIGRDYLEFTPLDFRRLALALGDTSGDDASRSLMNTALRTFVREFAGAFLTLPQMVEALNRTTCGMCPDDFWATLFYAAVDPVRRQLQYVSAGHEPAILVRAEAGRVQLLESTGTVLGLTGRTAYRERTLKIGPGDVLVAVSDGIVEIEKVLEVVLENPALRARDLAMKILETSAGSRQADDRTVAVVRMLNAAERPLFEASTAELALVAA